MAQLRAATPAAGVVYFASLGESSALAGNRVDLITVAQAFHWLDQPRFYSEVDRVAAPGAALAIWGYGLLRTAPAIEAIIHQFHNHTVGPYWSAARQLVVEGYRGFELPIEEVTAPPFAIAAALNLPDLLGYLRTWSAVGKFLEVHRRDPVAELAPELAAHWGDPATPQEITWPLFVRAGRWKPERRAIRAEGAT